LRNGRIVPKTDSVVQLPTVRSTTPSARDAETKLRQLADPKRAAFVRGYFKCGPGEYGEGDRFFGLSVPQIRQLAREFRDLSFAHVETLLESPWHEARLLSLVILADRYPKADARAKSQIYELYLRRTDRINNWDLVDASAGPIVGAHLLERSRAPLHRLAKSRNLWERRIAIVATQHLISRGQFDDTLRLSVSLFGDAEDLIHKAVGWMLREVGKRDKATLRRFLDNHAGAMPRTTLRYAIERLSPLHRARYMAAPRRSTRR
jgi:3-methyladenine DNA glycosylase AlkD